MPLLLAVSICWTSFSAESPSLEALQGKWTSTKMRDGQAYSQTLELEKDKLVFQILDADNQVRVVVKSTVIAEKFGVFNGIVLTNLEIGKSASELQSIDETRSFIYKLREDRLYIAANFDRESGSEKPVTDEYVRDESSVMANKAATAVGNDAVVGTWKMQVSMDTHVRDYTLKIENTDGKLSGTLISPRSGEYPCRVIQFKNGELLAEVEREVGGNSIVLVMKAKVTDNRLTGTIAAKGAESLYTGSIKASK